MKLVGAGSAAGLLGTGSVTAESTDATDSVGSDPYEARSVEFPDDAGVVNVTDAPYNAAGDGTTDDTAAIQAALDDYPSANKIIYLPDGTYLVSDTIEWPDGGESGGGDDEKRTILQGQSRANTTIVLEDDAEEFQNPDDRKAVVRAGEGVAQRFRNAIRTLTVDTGSGNSGAAGIQFMANNQGTMRGVKIVSGDGQGTIGLDLAYNNEIGPQLIRDLRVVGFDYGVKTAYAVNSMTFENVVLDGQNEAGIYNASQVFSVNGLTSRNAVPAVVNTYDTEHADTDDDAGVLTVFDAKLKSTEHGKPSQPAIENEAGLYARDVVTPGYAAAIENAAGHETDVGSRSVREFTSHGTFNELPLPRRRFKSLRLPVEPSPRVPWDPVSEWANPEDYGGDPDDDGDDTAAIQAAIDSGVTTVYLPNRGGNWTVDGTLELRGNVRRFIGCEGNVAGGGTIKLADGTQDVVVTQRLDALYSDVDLVHDSERTWLLSSLTVSPLDSAESQYSSTENGTGDVFFDDCSIGTIFPDEGTPSTLMFEGQSVWARQLNVETDTDGPVPAEAKIVSRDADLWILGLKTEQAGTVIKTVDGGRTELLGAHVYSQGDVKTDPMFEIRDSSVSLASVGEFTFENPYEEYVNEIRGGIKRVLTADDVPDLRSGGAGGGLVTLYTGWGPDPDPSEYAPYPPTLTEESTLTSDGSVDLVWDGSPSAESYVVERSTSDGGPYEVVANGITDTTYTDSTVGGDDYYYVVSAVNGDGLESEPSNQVQIDTTPPVTGLQASVDSDANVELAWESLFVAESYAVKRSTSAGGPYEVVADGITDTAFTDTTVDVDRYYYVVTATTATGYESEPSEQVEVYTNPPPTNVQGEVTSGGDIALTWDASPTAEHYPVKRATSDGGPYDTLKEVTGTSFTDTTAGDDVYFYVVTGVSEGGLESVDSPQRVVRTVESPLEAYYPLDYQPEDFAYDAGGLGRDATPEGGVTTGVDGAVNAAYSFDGEDDKLSTPGLVINDTEFTVATWFQYDAHDPYGQVLEAGGIDRNYPDGWNVQFAGSDDSLQYNVWDPFGGFNIASTPALSSGEWYFLAVVGSGDDVRLHVYDTNGELDGSPYTGTGARNTTEDGVGLTLMEGQDIYTDGRIDEVFAYSRTLSASEIDDLYQGAVIR
jgi:fibronectin type 3 domain-containing protein